MTLDLAKLKEAAEKATQGSWKTGHQSSVWSVYQDGQGRRVHQPIADASIPAALSADQCTNNATYIALASPATILALIERLESAEMHLINMLDDGDKTDRESARAHMEKRK